MRSYSICLRDVLACVLGITALASSGTAEVFQATPEKAVTRELVRQALTDGAYSDADRLADDLCARVEAEQGSQSLALAQALDLLVESQLKNGKAGLTFKSFAKAREKSARLSRN